MRYRKYPLNLEIDIELSNLIDISMYIDKSFNIDSYELINKLMIC